VKASSGKGSVMVRRTVSVAGVAALLGALIMIPNAGASGGGACPPPLTNGRTTTVRIKNFCYGPTVVHVDPGDSVSWTNRDSFDHTVTGANRSFGSYRTMPRNKSAAWRFESPGVYPYYCVIHPGMVGAVVVGGGSALAASDAIERGDVKRVSALEPSSAEFPTVPEARPATEPDLSVSLLAGAGIVVALVGSAGLRRRFTRSR
jgi:plastocyanin